MLVNGNIENADMPGNWIKAGHEVTGKPDKLKGFYKYTETQVMDSAIAEVILKKMEYSEKQSRHHCVWQFKTSSLGKLY